jgi:hypothetical protein
VKQPDEGEVRAPRTVPLMAALGLGIPLLISAFTATWVAAAKVAHNDDFTAYDERFQQRTDDHLREIDKRLSQLVLIYCTLPGREKDMPRCTPDGVPK